MNKIIEKNGDFNYVVMPSATGVVNGKSYTGMVVCFIKEAEDNLAHDISSDIEKLANVSCKDSSIHDIKFNGKINHRFAGVAYCLDGDLFDIELGKVIAKKKALKSLTENKLKGLNKYIEEQNVYLSALEDRREKYLADISRY